MIDYIDIKIKIDEKITNSRKNSLKRYFNSKDFKSRVRARNIIFVNRIDEYNFKVETNGVIILGMIIIL